MTVALMRPFMAPPYAHYMSCFRAKSLKCNETIETSHTGKWISFFTRELVASILLRAASVKENFI